MNEEELLEDIIPDLTEVLTKSLETTVAVCQKAVEDYFNSNKGVDCGSLL